jgi:hypothetical protein
VTEQAVHVRGPESLLDDLLPRFDVRQVHEAWVPAPVDVVYSAVKQVTGSAVRVLMPLEFLRWLSGFLIGCRPFGRIRRHRYSRGLPSVLCLLVSVRAGRLLPVRLAASGAQLETKPHPCEPAQILLPSPNLATRRRRLRSPSSLSGMGLA